VDASYAKHDSRAQLILQRVAQSGAGVTSIRGGMAELHGAVQESSFWSRDKGLAAGRKVVRDAQAAKSNLATTLQLCDQWLGVPARVKQLRAALDADEQHFAAGTTTGDRLRRQTAVAALELADALEAAIAQGTIPAGSTELAWDDALTARQIGGALLLDVGDCEEAQIILQALVDAPELAARPTVAAAAQVAVAWQLW
jgi:hypothetical protein